MFKTTRSSEVLSLKTFRAKNNKVVEIDGRVNEIIKNSFKSKKSKNEKSKNSTYIIATKEPIFLTTSTKKAFN